MEKDEKILKEAEEEAKRIKNAESAPVVAPVKEDNNKTGNNKSKWLVLTIVALLIVAIVLLVIIMKPADKKSNNNEKESNNNTVVENKEENKEENNNNTEKIEDPKDDVQKSLVLIENIRSSYMKLIYDDDSLKEISNINHVIYGSYLDKDILYFKDADNNFYSVNINDENLEPQKIEYEFGGAEKKDHLFRISFSVVDGVVYYFTREENGYYANSYDLNSNQEEKQQLNIQFDGKADFSDGVVAYFIDDQHDFYSYNFISKELKKIGSSKNLIENKGNYLLLGSSEDFCVYDKEKAEELYCVPVSNITRTQQINVDYPVTLKDSSILFFSDNKIVECTDSNSCNNIVYTLTEEQQNADYKDIIYYSNKLLLELGYNPNCDEGCTCESYKIYNVLDNNKEMPFKFDNYRFDYRFF